MDAANFFFSVPQGEVFGYIGQDALQRLILWDPLATQPKPYRLHSTPNMTLGRELAGALENYFAGAPESFARIPLDASGTEFQQRVWAGARAVAWGRTASYGELTAQLGLAPTSARAVGAALGANPIHLLIPCHRFLGANGNLTGFAGGLPWKRALLEREGSLLSTGE